MHGPEPIRDDGADGAQLDQPTLDDGVTLLRPPDARSTALHRLVVDALADADRAGGPAYWVDARNAAVSHALYRLAPADRALRGLQVARAFTAYQHLELVRTLARRARPGTRLVVAPNVASLYRDGDVPDGEADRLLRAALATLSELGDALDCPVVVSATGDDDHADRVADAADRVVDCERTALGLTYDAPGFDVDGYHRGDHWQTTIPYWVDLCGRLEPVDPRLTAEVPA
ncbi:hypothetical protein [Halobaculum sp. P14]|uniref:hypothetical protein n=1 Tax=Halobaculum sp. P14 TaxID=3421638 RepID=UPI003EBFEABF